MEPSAEQSTSPIQMVVGYDFSENSQIALERAIALAEAEPAHFLHILTVLDDKTGLGVTGKKGKLDYNDTALAQETLTKDITTRLDAAQPTSEIHFFVHARLGDPANEVLRLAQEVGAHLIIAGSHGRTGIKRMLMGSVSEKIVREAKCPVLVVREREYEDVKFDVVIAAPADHAESNPYVQPHRYSYSNKMLQKVPSSWTLY